MAECISEQLDYQRQQHAVRKGSKAGRTPSDTHERCRLRRTGRCGGAQEPLMDAATFFYQSLMHMSVDCALQSLAVRD